MKIRIAVFFGTLILLSLFTSCMTEDEYSQTRIPELKSPAVLEEAAVKTAKTFDKLIIQMRTASMRISVLHKVKDKEGIRETVADIARSNPQVLDFSLIGIDGKMIIVEPEAYHKFEGSDVSSQEQVKRALSGKSVISKMFLSVEGVQSLDLEIPVLNEKNEVIGTLSALICPGKFFGDIISPMIKDSNVEIWMMDMDGRILYDVDKEEIGLNLFSDNLYQPYKSLLEAGRRMISGKEKGHISYDFLETGLKKPVTKSAFWRKMDVLGEKWVVVATVPVESR